MAAKKNDNEKIKPGEFYSSFRQFFLRHKERVNKAQYSSLFGISEGDSDDHSFDAQNIVFSIPVDHSGNSIYAKGWLKPDSDSAPVILVHDLGEHISLYQSCAKKLNEAGFSVFGYDIRGHGRSGQFLGHAPSFDCLINDLLQMVAWIRYKSNRQKPIVIAQGIGSLIAVHFEASHPGVVGQYVLVSPVLELPEHLSKWRSLLVRSIAGAAPRLRLPRPLVPRFGPKVTKTDLPQRLLAHGISASFASELMFAAFHTGWQFQSFRAESLFVIPHEKSGYDYSYLKEMIDFHPAKSKFNYLELEGIGLQPLTTGQNQLQIVVEKVVDHLLAKKSNL
jgi:pimeloyl-ACP methyl ester carboxylesterase